MRAVPAFLLGLVCASTAGLGCGEGALTDENYPRRVAEILCERRVECECEGASHRDCVRAWTAVYEREREGFADVGLHLAPTCAEQSLGWYQDRPCGTHLPADRPDDPDAFSCRNYGGEGKVGDSCTWPHSSGQYYSSCESSLWCVVAPDGVPRCAEELGQQELTLGEPCRDSFSGLEIGICGEEIWCGPSGLCEASSELGESCSSSAACEQGTWCDRQSAATSSGGVCEVKIPDGDPCACNSIYPSDCCESDGAWCGVPNDSSSPLVCTPADEVMRSGACVAYDPPGSLAE